MSVPSNREHHYRNLRDRYTNCTYVDGNLELTWLQDESFDLSFLQYIREVTGYVLISHVDVRRIVLPRLQIIRGRTTFKINIQDEEFALFVTLSKMHTLEMPALRDILSGSVGMFNNYNLCHIRTINWDEIITGHNAKYTYVYNFTSPERECPVCHANCTAGCWGEGVENCQQFSKTNCSPQCWQGRCFGPEPRQCCHLFCAGGCTGPKQSDCLACRNFYDDGVCTQECPAMQRYNPVKYRWETNPHGKYAYGATCVKNCPEHLLKDNGACVRSCPPQKKAVNGECVPCGGPCPKTCEGVQTVHAGNIDDFQGCTIIEGSLTILDQSFKGFQMVYSNYSFGPRYPMMHPDRLEVFSTLKEVTGYVNIQGYHEQFTNLSYFRNLEVIGGRALTEYFASLYIVKTSLRSLGLRSLQKVHSGSIAILENKNLCFAQGVDWKRIKKSSEHNTLLQNNKKEEECISEGLVCDKQCSSEGCWGPGPTNCLSCAKFQFEDTCLPDCDTEQGPLRPLAGKAICRKCHPRCKKCTGYGFHEQVCQECTKFKRGEQCEDECLQDHFAINGSQDPPRTPTVKNWPMGHLSSDSPTPQNQRNWELLRYAAAIPGHPLATAAALVARQQQQQGIPTHPELHRRLQLGLQDALAAYGAEQLKQQRDDASRGPDEDCCDTGASKREAQVGSLKLDLPLDEDDYLMPSPQTSQGQTTYMDLIGDASKMSAENGEARNGGFRTYPDFLQLPGANGIKPTSVDNPEYHLVSNEPTTPVTPSPSSQPLGIPITQPEPPPPAAAGSSGASVAGGPAGGQMFLGHQPRSSEEESDHEYYNDLDRLQRELQPLKPLRRNETTV
ncbi:Epidermal growth factor receptor [Frankliniella fusca]|uniref:receptor protein-tyrosine kinase n=1 Tax=Frankliniella fusca TaxID=407009 RepID=A0AAE1HIQ1_9NEOP|nr:Epidermal growth factor receptor [Frankliniella fusca]